MKVEIKLDQNNPYSETAMEYVMAGWMPIVLPYAKKAPPPSGVTGWGGVYPDEDVVLGDWVEQGGNIGLKMPPNVIGLDIDGAAGYARFKALEKQLGELPGEWMITSHESHTEGFTAFFTVPDGVQFMGQVAENIDVIQASHRYQTAPPSVHPDSCRVYEWRAYAGSTPLPFIPEADTLPPLPQAWIDFFRRVESTPGSTPESTLVTLDMSGVGCNMMRSIVSQKVSTLQSGKVGRHDAMVAATWAIICESSKGHGGASHALREYKNAWLRRFRPSEKASRDLDNEFGRAVYGAIAKMSSVKTGCTCGQKSSYTKRSISGSKDLRMWR